MSRKWVAFFSQTGSEICNIIDSIKKEPDLIITNKQDLSDMDDRMKKKLKKIIVIPNKPTLSDYNNLLLRYFSIFKDCFVTLHGYLRIIPKEVCERLEIYNLHPGLINKYPELKGFNPQEKAFNLKLPRSGAVIHKVVPEIDSGEILDFIEINIENKTLDEIYSSLHSISSDLWIRFIKSNLI